MPDSAPMRGLAGFLRPLLLALMGLVEASSVSGQVILTKADNTTTLDQVSSWVAENAVPNANTIGVWDSTLTSNFSFNPGNGIVLGGIEILNPAQAITLNAGTLGITLGSVSIANAIDMTQATVNLTIASSVTLAVSQTWNVASGKFLNATGIIYGASTGITKQGAGTLVLTGNNAYTGATTISAGTLQVGDGVNTGVVLGSIMNDASLVFNIGSSGETYTNLISGSGSLTKAGSGMLTLTHDETYTGGTTISDGTLQLGNFSNTGTVVGNILDNANLVLAPNATISLTYSGVISGSGNLTVNHNITLTAANTYSGATNVSGLLTLDFAAIGAPAALIINEASALTLNGANLHLNGAASISNSQAFSSTAINSAGNSIILTTGAGGALDLSLGTLTRSAGATVDFVPAAAGTISVASTSMTNGIITSSSGVVFATVGGADWATVSGGSLVALANYQTDTNPTHWQSTDNVSLSTNPDSNLASATISSLKFSGSSTITVNNGSVLTVGAGGVLATNSAASNIMGGTLTAGSGNELVILPNSGSRVTLSSIIANNNGPVGLTMSGPGTLFLNATNTYTGNTTLNDGTLALGNSLALKNSILVDNSGNLVFNGLTSATLSGLSGNGGIRLSNDAEVAVTLTVAQAAAVATTYSGALSGSGTVVKSGAGTLTFNGLLQNSGGFVVNSGTLIISPTANSMSSGPYTINSGTLLLQSAAAAGTGTITLNGGNLTSGTSSFIANTLNIAANGNISSSVPGGGLLRFAPNAGSLTGSGTLFVNTAGTISGVDAVNMNGIGSGTANGLSAFGGTLSFLPASFGIFALGTYIHPAVATTYGNSTFTLDLGASSVSFGPESGGATITIGALKGAGAASSLFGISTSFDSAGNTTYIIGGNNLSTTFNGTISDDFNSGTKAALVKVGTGTLTLGGAVTIGGGVDVEAGTLAAANANPFGGGVNSVIVNGGVLDLGGFNSTFTSLSGTGGVITNNSTGSGTTTLTLGGFSGPDTQTAFAGVITDGTNKKLALTMADFHSTSTLTLAGANTFSGNTTIISGTLIISNPLALQNSTLTSTGVVSFGAATEATIGGLSGSFDLSLTNTANAAVALSVGQNNQNTTYGGTLSGIGSLTKVGTGTLILTGAGTYTGGVTISAGTLQLGNGTSTLVPSNLNVVNNGTLTLDYHLGVNQNYTGIISGTGNLVVLGGLFELAGTNTFTGTTTIAATGSMNIMNPLALQYSTVILNPTQGGGMGLGFFAAGMSPTLGGLSGAGNLQLQRSSTPVAMTVGNNNQSTTYSGRMSGPGSLTKIGTGTLTLTGNNFFTGTTTVSAGTLLVANAGGTVSGTGYGAVTVSAGGTLAGSGNIGGATTVAGTVLVGSASTAGLLNFSKGLTLQSTAMLDLQLGGTTRGTQYSAVNATNNLALGGTLAVNLINGYVPAQGSDFSLFQVTATTISNVFASVILPLLNNGLAWSTTNLYTTGDIATVAPSNFSGWASNLGLSGGGATASARPFGDGLANLVRYAMNLDTSAQPGGAPQPMLTSASGTTYLTLQYRVRKNMTDTQLVPQSSTDLVNWANVDSGGIAQLADDDAFTARYQARVPLPASGQLFLRVLAQTAQ